MLIITKEKTPNVFNWLTSLSKVVNKSALECFSLRRV